MSNATFASKYVNRLMTDDLESTCEWVARKRYEDAVKKNRAGHNGAPAQGNKAFEMDLMGARCEGIAWDWLGKPKWNALLDDIRDVADIEIGGLKIDVKGISQPHLSLIVQLDDPPEWIYLLVSRAGDRLYEIQGWLFGHEVKSYPVIELQPGRPAHVVRGKDKLKMHDPSTIQDVREIGLQAMRGDRLL